MDLHVHTHIFMCVGCILRSERAVAPNCIPLYVGSCFEHADADFYTFYIRVRVCLQLLKWLLTCFQYVCMNLCKSLHNKCCCICSYVHVCVCACTKSMHLFSVWVKRTVHLYIFICWIVAMLYPLTTNASHWNMQ